MAKQKYLDLPDFPPPAKPDRAIAEAIEMVRAEALLMGITLEPCPLYSDTILMHCGVTWELRSAGSVTQLRKELRHFFRTVKGFPKEDADVIHTATPLTEKYNFEPEDT